jgi:D-alanyl-D-alanine carboxypeptidase
MPHDGKKLALLTAVALMAVGLSILIRVSRAIIVTPEEVNQANASGLWQYVAPDASFFGAKDSSSSSNKGNSNNNATAPTGSLAAVTAKAYLVGNVASGKIYLERNSGNRMPVASMSKLVTAIIATETLSSTSTIEITPVEATTTSSDSSGIIAAEKFTAHELLYPLLLNSSNIAAEAIASSSNRVKFLELMSSYAWEIGMPQTYFVDPSGIDPHNQASAKDIFSLAQYLYKYRPDILELTRTKILEIATTSDHGAHVFASIHPFVNDSRFIGGKTGRTKEAGDTMLTILRINGQGIAFVVMGSANGAREGDTRILIDALGRQL